MFSRAWLRGFPGFAGLSYEIIWYRLLMLGSGDTAAAFASLLGAYLFCLALGSRSVERYSRNHDRESAVRRLSAVLFLSAMFTFAVGPLSALALTSAVYWQWRIGRRRVRGEGRAYR